MIISYTEGKLTATAENIEDIGLLLALKPTISRHPTSQAIIKRQYRKTGKVYKRQYKRPCEICGKQCRGLVGLATHKRLTHKSV